MAEPWELDTAVEACEEDVFVIWLVSSEDVVLVSSSLLLVNCWVLVVWMLVVALLVNPILVEDRIEAAIDVEGTL